MKKLDKQQVTTITNVDCDAIVVLLYKISSCSASIIIIYFEERNDDMLYAYHIRRRRDKVKDNAGNDGRRVFSIGQIGLESG